MQSSVNVAEHQGVLSGFFDDLQKSVTRVLMLDYDGTLAPFTPDRAYAIPYPEVPGLISRIMQCRTRVALISGRAAADVLRLCRIYPHPEIWGSHGAERIYTDGSYRVERPTAAQQQTLESISHALHAAGIGSHIETKPAGIAIHWRGFPAEERAAIEDKVRAVYSSRDKNYSLQIVPFDGGLEILTMSRNKGDAVKTVLRESGMEVAAAYLGDDQTDEDAFRAIKGHGLAVLVRNEARSTAADAWLRPPAGLIKFFQEWLVACGEAK